MFNIFFILLLLVTGCTTKKIQDLTKKGCDMSFCIYELGEKPDKTLVYFPGLLDTKKALEKSIFDITDITKIIEAMVPVRVIVYSEANVPDHLAWFVKSPDRINNVLSFAAGKIYGLGHSMGGYNLAAFAAMSPKTFQKIVLVNPLLLPSTQTPFDTVSGPALLLEGHFTKKEWETLNPMVLANANYPKTLISSCKTDFWGLMPAAKSFYELLHSKNVDVTLFQDKPGCKHEDIPYEEVIGFLK